MTFSEDVAGEVRKPEPGDWANQSEQVSVWKKAKYKNTNKW